MNAHPVYRSNPRHPIKVLITMHLVHQNTRCVPWVGEKALALIGEQNSTGHDIGPKTSKSSSPPEVPNRRILKGCCGAKGFGDPGPFHIKLMAHSEEEEMSEDEQRKSRLPRHTVEDNLVLGEPRSRKGKAPRH